LAVFAGLTLEINRQADKITDRPRYVCNNGPHVLLYDGNAA